MRAVIDDGPYTGQAALEAGLVDRLAHEDVVLSELRQGEGASRPLPAMRRVDLDDYQARVLPTSPEGRPSIAVVHALGPILRGTNGFDSSTAAADDVAAALAAAREDPAIRAVLFRISSPGGSAVGSETIGREIVRLRGAGKPVIVSMGDVAGSGGYWIAADADMIIADPATLTGSIGVLAGKPVLEDLWSWLDVQWSATSHGANAGIWSLNKPYTPAEQAKVNAALDSIYAAFKERVAAGRGLSPEQVEEIARGRVWTGAEALPIGLVDQLGGLFEAIGAVKERLGLQQHEEVTLVLFPDPRESLGRLVGRLGRSLTAVSLAAGQFLGVLSGGAQPVALAPAVVR
jgi:protease-4